MKVLAVIPARGGSKGVPRKNIKLLGNRPLIDYTIKLAEECKDVIDRCVVSTEDAEIKRVAQKCGAEVLDRPSELAEDKTKSEPVLTHAVEHLEATEGYRPDAVLLLAPVCPFRKPEDIREAIQKMEQGNYDTVIGLKEERKYVYKIKGDDSLDPQYKRRANRQERDPIWVENGVLYLSKVELIKEGKIFGEKMGYVVIDDRSSVNIDEPLDFLIAENVLKQGEIVGDPEVLLKSEQIEKIISSLGGDPFGENLLRNKKSSVIVSRGTTDRGMAPKVEVHDKYTDVLLVKEGEEEFFIGGEVLDKEPATEPGEWTGTALEGARKYSIKAGDIIVVPKGVPHQHGVGQIKMVVLKIG